MAVTKIALALFVCALAWGAEGYEDEVYGEYSTAARAGTVEMRPVMGYDFSDPFLNIYSAGVGVDYRVHPLVAVGVEGSLFSTSENDTLKQIEPALKPGHELNILTPLWSSALVIRWIPFSSLTNVLSRYIIVTDIGVGLRAGATRYNNETALLAGARFDVSFGLSPGVSFGIGINWDIERLASAATASRIGLRVGPTFVF